MDRTQVIIVAGGRAKRLGMDIPKCLLEISGKKLVDMSIESLAKEGFHDFVSDAGTQGRAGDGSCG